MKGKSKENLEINSRKSIWVYDDRDLFVTKFVESETTEGGENVVICTDGSKYKLEEVFKTNPEKFATVSDLSQLSYINEPSVLQCLKNRLEISEIYTNSGMFLISVNPYKKMADLYSKETKRKIETKRYDDPHIFKTVDLAYEAMVETGINQSILITGESGAGKTENTKKVIEYLSFISGDATSNINELLISANPLVEAFGNAKTIKNENSSRFGKFIQVFFTNKIISGGKIDTYLLEISRVTKQERGERNYHIFYYLLKAEDQDLLGKLSLSGKTYKDFKLLRDGSDVAYGIDDKVEFEEVLKCFKLFGMDYVTYFRGLAAIMHLSNLEFTEVNGKVEIKNMEVLNIVADLLNKELKELHDALVNPVVTAGRETIQKSTSVETCIKLVEAIIKNLYNKLFLSLIENINKVFACTNADASIGVLDIAGFEIFQINSFEQLLINYTNEKLQQFFNTKMFEEEQKTYKSEEIPWDYIDFGLGLDPCIKAIDGNNPIGILSYLDEECVMPGASDESVLRKIKTINIMQNNKKCVELISKKPECFGLNHYAGLVEYTVEDWIAKNKHISSDQIDELIGNVSMSKKKGIFRTVSQGHKEQLKQLMTMLSNTRPHFVRCILPNLKKRFGEVEKRLVLDQLRCNGILEGLRISRLGYPTRISFADFCSRYSFYVDESSQRAKKQEFAMKILEKLESLKLLSKEDVKIGRTMIFFKHGIVAEIENYRIQYLVRMSNAAQGSLRRIIANRKENAAKIMQDAVTQIKKDVEIYKEYTKLKWFRLYKRVKPLLAVRTKELEQAEISKKMEDLKGTIEKAEEENKYLQENVNLLKKKIVGLQEDHKREKDQFEYNLTQCEELNQGLRTDIMNKDKLLIEVEKNNKEFEDEFKKVNKKLEEKDDEISLLKNEAKKTAEKFEKQREENEEEIQRYVELTSKLKLDLQDKDAQITQKTSEITKFKHKEQELEGEIESLNKEVKHNKEKYVQLKDKFNKMVEENINKVDSEKTKQLEEEINGYVEKVEKLNNTIKTLKGEIEELKNENLNLHEEKLEETFKTEKVVSTIKNQMQTEIIQLKRKIADLEEDLENNEGNSSMHQELVKLRESHLTKVNELEMKNYELQQKVSSIDLEDMRKELKNIKKNCKAAFASLTERLSTVLKESNKLLLEPYKAMEEMKKTHNVQIEQYKKYFAEMFDKAIKEDTSESMLGIKVQQLERIIENQEKTIQELTHSKKKMKNVEKESSKESTEMLKKKINPEDSEERSKEE
ncbi:myosin [Ecytonucleospora hepatopenaei]|uniref:Myosin n=1 Tax=Ecytonucleospora hepatopenaei TaxID=646526 RepID=A0A1W0E5Z2_9MICR|nr:myosin [Ecytonucleospora hepatopenaei]